MTETDVLEISLSGAAAAQVREALASWEYGSADEVVADALRSWHREPDDQDVAYLKAAWNEAVQDPRPALEPRPVFEEVRARLAARVERS